MNLRNNLAVLLLVFYGFDLGYLVRRGILQESLLTSPGISDTILLAMLALALLRPRYIVLSIQRIPSVSVVLLIVILATAIAYIYATITGWYVPFSIEYRLLIQGLSFAGSVVAGVMVGHLCANNPRAAIKALFVGLGVILLGVVWQLYHDGVSGALSNRFHGISGEPKGLALFLVPYIVAFSIVPVVKLKSRLIVLSLCLGTVLFTYSATGLVALIWCFVISTLMFKLVKKPRTLILVAALGFAISYILAASPDLYEKLVDRIFDRAQGEYTDGISVAVEVPVVGAITVDGNDAPVLRFLIHNPLALLTGVGYGFQTVFSYPFLVGYDSGFLSQDYSGYITPNLAVLNNFPNYGLIPLLLLGVLVWRSVHTHSQELPIRDRFLMAFFLSHFVISMIAYSLHFSVVMSAIVIYFIAARARSMGYTVSHVKNRPIALHR